MTKKRRKALDEYVPTEDEDTYGLVEIASQVLRRGDLLLARNAENVIAFPG